MRCHCTLVLRVLVLENETGNSITNNDLYCVRRLHRKKYKNINFDDHIKIEHIYISIIIFNNNNNNSACIIIGKGS